MIQMFRLPQSGASTCYVLSGKYYDRTYICSQRLQNSGILRNQSDSYISRPAINKKVTKTKRNPGPSKRVKETEILKITETEATQTTMTIGKLNASHVAAFVEEPGMILKNVKNAKTIRANRRNDVFSSGTLKFEKDNLGSISSNVKEINDLKSPLRNIQNIIKSNVNIWEKNQGQYSIDLNIGKFEPEQKEIVTSEGLSTQASNNDLLLQRILQEINAEAAASKNESVNSFASVSVERTKSELQENHGIESSQQNYVEESKKEESSRSLHSSNAKFLLDPELIHPFIDVCVHCNLLDHAFNFLTRRARKKVKNPEVYHTLLRKFAENGDWFQAQLLVKKMESFGVTCTPQTFALDLLSVANGEMCDALERTALILEKIRNKGFQVYDLFTKTSLKIDEREIILKQVRKLMPHFDIPPTTVNLNSNCSLVENLHKNQQEPLTSPAPFINKEFISQAVERQLSLEEKQICTIKKIGGTTKYSAKHRKIWKELNETWAENFRKSFNSALEALSMEFDNGTYKNNIYPYLLTLSVDTFVQLAAEEIDQLVHLSDAYSESTYSLYQALGHRVYQMYCKKKNTMDEEFNKRMKRQIEIYCRWYANPNGPARNARQKWQMLMGDNPDIASAVMSTENVVWSHSVEMMIGKFLYNLIFKSALIPGRFVSPKFNGEVPAFYLVLRQKNMKVREEIKFHPVLSTIIEKANYNIMKVPTYLLPMMCPPKPWSTPDNGGYYFLSTELLRSHSDKINKDFVKSVPNQNLYAVYDSLNKLQSVPWTINEEVLDVAIEVFNSGGSEELSVPVKPDTKPLGTVPRNLDYHSKIKLFKERRDVLSKRQCQYGLWCEGLYKLSLANHFRKQVFWLPQNLDFRGRVYPVPPHVSHVSADLFRSLLIFAKKERLGEKGFDWLKVPLMKQLLDFGVISLENKPRGRAKSVIDKAKLKNIVGSNPQKMLDNEIGISHSTIVRHLNHIGKVKKLDKWIAHELTDMQQRRRIFSVVKKRTKIHAVNLTGAHKKKSLKERLEYANEVLPDILDSADNPLKGKRWWVDSDDPWQTLAACFEIRKAVKSGNPKMYKSGFPVHQDGSCNGLQHYAALGRDTCGAISVNLSPSETPQDVYSDVAALLEVERAKDEANGVEIAKVLNGFVSRKVVKRPVMTTVYGVTWFGAKLQISGVLTDLPNFPKNKIEPASSYLATKIFETLRKLFTSAKEIQDWFNKCSDVITSHYNESISWVNPIGLPVIQPYFSKTKLSTKPDMRKQRNAFAPNFIHSLDSTHMMLTALNCEPAGITFASVHDCFWTHPSRVDDMNRICRENFVALHSQKVLEDLSQHFIRTYSASVGSEEYAVFTDIPKLGDFDLNTVKDSVYFFA